MKNVVGIFFACFIFLFSTVCVYAQSGSEILDNVGQHLQPESLQKQQETPTTFLGRICALVNIPLICPGAKVQVLVPSEKTITEEEITNIETALNLLESDVAGTSSAQVLGITDINLLSWLINDEERGVTALQFPSQTLGNSEFYSDDPETAVQNLAQLYSFEKDFGSELNEGIPEPISPVVQQPTGTVSTPGIQPTPPPSGYQVYYQNDPLYASFQLPGPDNCTYIQAACGPFSVVNALVNSGVTRIDGQTVTPQYIVNHYYPFATCAGTGILAASNILATHGFTVDYNFNIDYASSQYKTPSQVAGEFKNYTDSGWKIFALADFYSSSRNKWIGHFFLIVRVANGKIYTLDPYYGYGQPIPFDQSTMTVRYKSAFRFRRV